MSKQKQSTLLHFLHSQDLIPLIVTTALLRETDDTLLSDLFNLVKKPDDAQR
jgi:hypothetical protein